MPRFVDIDHDGDYDLFCSYIYGSNNEDYIVYYRNIGSPQVPNLIIADTLFSYLAPPDLGGPNPCFADIDNDGDEDMFLGEDGGAMLFYRNLENPFQAQLTITIQDNDIILTWGDVSNAVEYQIFYRDIPYFTPSGIPQAIVFPPDTVWTDEGVLLVDPKRWYRMITQY